MQAEAEMAVALFIALHKTLRESGKDGEGVVQGQQRQVSVAVITPYREQRRVLQNTFRYLCGPSYVNQVKLRL
jgi:hypothetical protein